MGILRSNNAGIESYEKELNEKIESFNIGRYLRCRDNIFPSDLFWQPLKIHDFVHVMQSKEDKHTGIYEGTGWVKGFKGNEIEVSLLGEYGNFTITAPSYRIIKVSKEELIRIGDEIVL